ncbi:hypothetical protein [Pseudomonas sp. 5P_3.1_Bac2]|uniref:hypothetical protein n=1 Tax=Pseudomonas sp. 5P_3.1_Bac2 TaxID=2971617 RepID=UPI0021C6A785|nr:hypothetical protein [Pseudomonas sp. 5P_3.1_Bac2]MCU1716364.1 hypothetical protein [Pseudomonas sp. 5P_3.1_Bac2]
MRRPLLALVLCSSTALALEVTDSQRFTCQQGDCFAGDGTVWDALLGVSMQGPWAKGRTQPGQTYTLSLPSAPGSYFKQRYGQDGLLESGDSPRSVGVQNAVVGFFNGTYTRIQHPFMRGAQIAVIDKGLYNTGTGFEYRGRFQYLPAKGGEAGRWASGYYVFYGDKVDTEEQQSEHGMFISDETPGGTQVRFVKADPSYLPLLQEKYQRDLQIAQGEFRRQDSQRQWLQALSLLSSVAVAVTTSGNPLDGMSSGQGAGADPTALLTSGLINPAGYSGNVSDDIAINLVSAMFNSDAAQLDVTQLALQAVGMAVDDQLLAGQLQKLVEASSDGSTAANLVDALGSSAISQSTASVGAAVSQSSGSAELGALTNALLTAAVTSTDNRPPAAPAEATTNPPSVAANHSSLEQAGPVTRVNAAPPANSTPRQASAGNPAAPGKHIAQLDRVAFPAGLELGYGQWFASNDGLYLPLKASADGRIFAAKLTRGRGSPAGWLTSALPAGASFALSSMATETANAFSVNWATEKTYGAINLNNNGTQSQARNDAGPLQFIPGGAQSQSIDAWALSSRHIYRKSSGGNASQDFSQNYRQLAQVSGRATVAAAAQDGARLFIADGLHSILEISATGTLKRHDLASLGNGTLHTLIHAHDRLWIGYGERILSLDRSGKISPFSTMSGIIATNTAQFCLAGSTLFTADGQVFYGVDVTPSRPRGYLHDAATLKEADMQDLLQMQTALRGGMYCGVDQGSQVIYALGSTAIGSLTPQLFSIRPL